MADSKTSDLVMELNSMLFNVSVASAVGWRRYARRFKRCAPLFFAASGTVACDAGAVVERTIQDMMKWCEKPGSFWPLAIVNEARSFALHESGSFEDPGRSFHRLVSDI
eukprot:scaffold3675_cov89-Skeletonema_marinoi.AAC.1